jgi:hypothetical protein
MPLRLEILTPEKAVYDDEVDMVIAPGSEGYLGILPHHAPLFTTLGPGELRVRRAGVEETLAVFGGFMDVRGDRVTVLTDAAEHAGVVPDVLLLAKGLGSGMPIGAMVAKPAFMTWPSGSHGSTCGGNPVSIAAALATIRLLEDELVENSARVGAPLLAGLRAALRGVPDVKDVRGVGLMIGVEFSSHERATAVARACYRRGLLVLECGDQAIRVSPPLTISKTQADIAVEIFKQACLHA